MSVAIITGASAGIGAALVRELESLGLTAKGVPGGARFEATLEQGARLAATLRTATSLLLEVARFPAPTLEPSSSPRGS